MASLRSSFGGGHLRWLILRWEAVQTIGVVGKIRNDGSREWPEVSRCYRGEELALM
jgi:hypothetical protein